MVFGTLTRIVRDRVTGSVGTPFGVHDRKNTKGSGFLGSIAPKIPSMAKTTAVKEAMTRTAIYADIAESTGLTKAQVKSVFEELSNVVERHVRKRSVGIFTLPGLLKIKTVKKPARKAQKGVPNPFKPGELMDVAAKPASVRVKILPLKKLKDFAL